MRDAAAARKWLPVIALGLVPLLFHTAIVASNYEPLGFVTPFGQWFKLGLGVDALGDLQQPVADIRADAATGT
jgi:hypothetical protein